MNELGKRIVQAVCGNTLFELPPLKSIRSLIYRILWPIGTGFKVSAQTVFYTEHNLRGSLLIGNNVAVGAQVVIDYSGGCTIGNNVWISHRTSIFTHEHPIDRSFIHNQTPISTPLVINDNVWVGYQTIILPSVNSIGEGAVIGAGSVVTHNVPAYTVVAGNPAKVIHKRKR